MKLNSKNKKKEQDSLPTAGFLINPHRITIFFNDYKETQALENGNFKPVIHNLIEKAFIAKGARPKHAIIALSGELSQATQTIVRFNRDESEQDITAKEYKKIKQKLELISQAEAEASVCEAFGPGIQNLTVINSQIINSKIDDFLINDPIGHKGKAVEMSFISAFAPQETVKELEKIFKSERLAIVTISDAFLAALSFAPKELAEIKDYILIARTGNSFDIAVIFANNVVVTRTLPLSSSFANTNPQWFIKGIEETLNSLDGIKTFPKIIIVLACKNCENLLKRHPWTKTLPFQENPELMKMSLPWEKTFSLLAKALN